MTASSRDVTRRSSRGQLVHRDDATSDLIESLFDGADALVERGDLVKDGDRCTVVRLDSDSGPIVIKRFNLRGALHTASHLGLRSRARWNWINAKRLIDGGVRTPQPVAMFEERRAGARLRSYLILPWIAGSPMAEYVPAIAHQEARFRALADQFASIFDALGSMRLGHGDMKATNFIVDSQERIWLIDLDGMRRHPPGPTLARARARDRARFLRNWQDEPEVEAIFRDRLDTLASSGE